MSRVSAVVIVLSTFVVLPGCFVGEFISSYFNTYYNAQRLFGEAEDEIWNLPETKQTGRDYLIPFNASATTKTKFASVIEKCSKLLQYHPESGLVDDALLMIGKSYFYEGEDQKAERKFRELIETYPLSSLVVEAKLMMAYTYFRMPERDSAQVYAKAVVDIAGKKGDDGFVARASNVLGQLELANKNYGPARQYFQQAAEMGDNTEIRSAAYLNVAQMYSLMGDYANAETAYRRAQQVSNHYLGEYRGQIGVARMQARQGKFNNALSALAALRSNANYKEFFGEIDLETANTLRDQGEIRAAIAQYNYVDTVYARSETSVNSYYQLGLLYEKKAFLYDSARVAYNKGKNESPAAKITPLITRRADMMNRYAFYRGEIIKHDSIRAALLMVRDSTVPNVAAVDSVRKGARDTTRSGTASIDTAKVARAVPGDTAKPKAPPAPTISMDSVKSRIAFCLNELGGLFFTGFELPDSARLYYNALLTGFPESPLVPRVLYTLAQIAGQDSTVDTVLVDSLYRAIINRFPQSEFAGEAQRFLGLPVTKKETDVAKEAYRTAERLMMAGSGVAAIDSFKAIAQRYPLSPLAPKALYAAGWLYDQSTDQRDSAIALYERLTAKYPYTQFAQVVGPKLAEVVMKKRADAQAAKDSTAKELKSETPPPQKNASKEPDDEIGRRPPSLPKPIPSSNDSTAIKERLKRE